jgi:hypothetical protein
MYTVESTGRTIDKNVTLPNNQTVIIDNKENERLIVTNN